MQIIFISIIVHMVLLFLYKKMGFVLYELLCATTYLVSLSFIQTLDITMPIYIAFALLPYIKCFQIKSFFSVSFLLYFSTVILISILLNGIAAPLSVFLIRLSGLLFFYYVFSNVDFDPMHGFGVVASLICEILLLILGLILSPNDRLMLNFQCTVGCIATSFVLLCAYDFYKRRSMLSFAVMLTHTLIACISGTRGYILVCLVVSFVSIILFPSIKLKLVALPILLVGFIIEHNAVFKVFENALRFGESTGRRTAENRFVIKFMLQRPFYNMLFGNGFGSRTTKFSISQAIISEVSDSSWSYKILQRVDSFHNLYFTILYSAGIVGVVMVLVLYYSIIKTSLTGCTNSKMKTVIVCFLLSYAVLLWYRWSATSGILEFAVLAYILNDIHREFPADKAGQLSDML